MVRIASYGAGSLLPGGMGSSLTGWDSLCWVSREKVVQVKEIARPREPVLLVASPEWP